MAAVLFAVASPVQAGRGISIDVNSYEIWGDASNGDVIPLEFPVNFGTGTQNAVTVNLPADWAFDSTSHSANVGLTFASSPADRLFATIGPGGLFFGPPQVPAVSISNSTQVSTPTERVADASNFNFGVIVNADMAPGACAPTDFCYAYGPLEDGAQFQFIDLASTGHPGDFQLNILCAAYPCENIGFSLGGEDFSAATFNPAAPPPNLVSYSSGSYFGEPASMWSFVFRNSAPVPEASTWASMILGFGLMGMCLRRKGKLGVQVN